MFRTLVFVCGVLSFKLLRTIAFFGLRKNKCCLYEVNIHFWNPWSSWWILLHQASCLLEMSIQESIWHIRPLFCMDVENRAERLRTWIVQNIWRNVYSWTDTACIRHTVFLLLCSRQGSETVNCWTFLKKLTIICLKHIRFFNFRSRECLFDDFLTCKWTFRQYITLDFETMTSLSKRFTL